MFHSGMFLLLWNYSGFKNESFDEMRLSLMAMK
jgi:hypothetical protein